MDTPPSNGNETPSPESDAPRARWWSTSKKRRALFNVVLRKGFGFKGYRSLKNRDWTFAGLSILGLGVIADLIQVLGPFAKIGLWLALAGVVILGIIILRRLKFCDRCVVPFLGAVWMAIVFGGFTAAQALTPTGDENGSILSMLKRIDATTQETQVAVDRTEKKVDSIAAEQSDLLAGFESLRQELGLSRAQTEGILKNFGHENIPADQWATKLNESAERLRELEARLSETGNDEPEIAALLQQAKAAIDDGNFDEADNLLGQAEDRDLEEGQRRIERSARSREQRGDLAHAAGRFLDAAEHYAAAAERIKPLDPLDWARLKYNQGIALHERGQYDPEPETLKNAINAYREALEERTRERVPLRWAMTQMNLGNALRALGVRESGTARLEEAATAFRHALEERTRERVPLQWATTQNNLGNTLKALGERESGTARLEEAVAAYRAALEEYTRDRVPLQWATTQNNLGIALKKIGERGDDDALLQAIACYRRALLEHREDNAPYYHQQTVDNLNLALALAEERGLDVPDETVPD